MTERAYTNDEIAELEGLRASIKALLDWIPVETLREMEEIGRKNASPKARKGMMA
jgi:hypothetical protein